MNTKNRRLRRASKTRLKIKNLKIDRLCIHRSNNHIYAQIISCDGRKVITQASSLASDFKQLNNNIEVASEVGKNIAKKAKDLGISKVAFDRSGYKYHGRVKALAESARANGLNF